MEGSFSHSNENEVPFGDQFVDFDDDFDELLQTLSDEEPSKNNSMMDNLSEDYFTNVLRQAMTNNPKLDSITIDRLEKYIKRAQFRKKLERLI